MPEQRQLSACWLDGWLQRGRQVTMVTAAADVLRVLDKEKRIAADGAECI